MMIKYMRESLNPKIWVQKLGNMVWQISMTNVMKNMVKIMMTNRMKKSLDNRRLLGLGRVGNRWSSLVTRTSLGLNSCYTFTTLFPNSIKIYGENIF